LVQHVRGQLGRCDVHLPPAESGQVAVAHLGAHCDAALGGARADPTHDRRVAGVESTGDVGAGDDVEQRVVVGERPGSEPLAEIGVEIHVHHFTALTLVDCRTLPAVVR
jgi:hypothetical protein